MSKVQKITTVSVRIDKPTVAELLPRCAWRPQPRARQTSLVAPVAGACDWSMIYAYIIGVRGGLCWRYGCRQRLNRG